MPEVVNTSRETLFKTAQDRMYSAVSAYYIWRHLGIAMNINNKGRAVAEKNVAILNDYGYFFHQIIPNTYKSFVADLAIFFDANKFEFSFSIEKLLASLIDKVSEAEIHTLKKEINKIKSKHGIKISLILELRNADVAHQEVLPRSRSINYSNIEELFSAVQEILNRLSRYHNNSFTVWDHLEDRIDHDIQYIFNNLERGEKIRLEEIEQEYKDLSTPN